MCAALTAGRRRVEVRQPSRNEALQSIPISAGGEVHIAALPAEPLDIVLTIGPWMFRRRIDLTRGLDERVVFDLHPIVVNGTVYYGRDVSPNAEVGF